MKIIAHISIVSANGGSPHVYSQPSKEYETNMIPTKEMEFEDPALRDPRPITNIIINPDEEYYFIYLGEEKYKDDGACVKRLEVFKDFGWKVV